MSLFEALNDKVGVLEPVRFAEMIEMIEMISEAMDSPRLVKHRKDMNRVPSGNQTWPWKVPQF